jgi:tetraacyldisaccharide 4'-kinase
MADARLAGFARRWWDGRLGVAGSVLDAAALPAAALYRGAVGVRNRAYDRGLLATSRAAVPVVSVGNIAVGGTGKTPFAHWIARSLKARGAHPAILHGGYADDEPALHRLWSPDLPVEVGRDRAAGAARAVAAGADVLVLDDAFQHRRMARDLDLVLVAAERGLDRVRLLPRGPWREPRSALRRADVVVLTCRTDADGAATLVDALRPLTGRPVVLAHIAPAGWLHDGAAAGPPPAPALAVAGVAEPDIFARSARLAGADVARLLEFPDHHAYDAADAARIRDAAAGAPIVTTEKDWMKLAGLLPAGDVWLLTQEVRILDGADRLAALLDGIATRAGAARGSRR